MARRKEQHRVFVASAIARCTDGADWKSTLHILLHWQPYIENSIGLPTLEHQSAYVKLQNSVGCYAMLVWQLERYGHELPIMSSKSPQDQYM